MKNLISISLLGLILTGCSTIESTIDAGKNIAGAIVDDVVDISKTAISIPVGAIGTVIDKIEEETETETEQDINYMDGRIIQAGEDTRRDLQQICFLQKSILDLLRLCSLGYVYCLWVVMKYKYIATERSVDVRTFEILSDTKLSEDAIEDAMALPDIDKVGDVEIEEGIQSTYLGTEYADDSKVKYYLESFAHNLKLIRGGKFFNNV